MRIHHAVLAGCAAVALFLLGCEMPRPLPTRGETGVLAPEHEVRKVIDPADVMLDLEAEDMKVWWRQDIGQIAEDRKLVDLYVVDDVLVAETRDASLFYFDATTGVWTGNTRLKSSLMAPPALYDKTFYMPSVRSLLAVDSESGLIQRRLAQRVPISCQPLPYYSFLILSGGNGHIICIDPVEERHVWTVSADGAVDEQPVIINGTLYAAGYKGKVVAVSVQSGIVLWQWEPRRPSRLVTGVGLSDGFVYVGDDRGFVHCLVRNEGVFMWSYPAGAPVLGAPVPAGDRLLVFTHGGGALCLQLGQEPRLLWRHPDGERLIATGKTDIYVLTSDRNVACISLQSGEEKWRLPLARGCLVASDPGKPAFYVGRPDGAIIAVAELE